MAPKGQLTSQVRRSSEGTSSLMALSSKNTVGHTDSRSTAQGSVSRDTAQPWGEPGALQKWRTPGQGECAGLGWRQEG